MLVSSMAETVDNPGEQYSGMSFVNDGNVRGAGRLENSDLPMSEGFLCSATGRNPLSLQCYQS